MYPYVSSLSAFVVAENFVPSLLFFSCEIDVRDSTCSFCRRVTRIEPGKVRGFEEVPRSD